MRFPSIFEHCAGMGFDMGVDLLPVTPAQHFLCGGVESAFLLFCPRLCIGNVEPNRVSRSR